jgi:hypothetical protein
MIPEMKFYFESFLEGNGRKNYVGSNKNCNLTSWIYGCELGWACCAGKEDEGFNVEIGENNT